MAGLYGHNHGILFPHVYHERVGVSELPKYQLHLNKDNTDLADASVLNRYALLAWIAQILGNEPEGRSLMVAATVTLTYMSFLRFHLVTPENSSV